ncbi:kinase-regulated stress-responsive transcription factor skn7 [Glugoides intestinalis]
MRRDMLLRKSNTFVRKLHTILEDKALSSIIKWCSNSGFEILDRKRFCEVVLRGYFKTSSFESFIRQLNKYNFTKKRNEDVFTNKEFIRNNVELLDRIRIKDCYGTLGKIQENTLCLSVFNKKVIKLLKTITEMLEGVIRQGSTGQRKVRVLIFEDFDVTSIIYAMQDGMLELDLVFLYSDFEMKITSKAYDYLVIDEELFEIFCKISAPVCYKPRIIVTTKHERSSNRKGVYKQICKPYDEYQLNLIIKKY